MLLAQCVADIIVLKHTKQPCYYSRLHIYLYTFFISISDTSTEQWGQAKLLESEVFEKNKIYAN